MGLYKRGNIWWTDETVNGHRYRKSTGRTDKDEARLLAVPEGAALAREGRVATRLRRRRNACRSNSAKRTMASSRFRAWLRWRCTWIRSRCPRSGNPSAHVPQFLMRPWISSGRTRFAT